MILRLHPLPLLMDLNGGLRTVVGEWNNFTGLVTSEIMMSRWVDAKHSRCKLWGKDRHSRAEKIEQRQLETPLRHRPTWRFSCVSSQLCKCCLYFIVLITYVSIVPVNTYFCYLYDCSCFFAWLQASFEGVSQCWRAVTFRKPERTEWCIRATGPKWCNRMRKQNLGFLSRLMKVEILRWRKNWAKDWLFRSFSGPIYFLENFTGHIFWSLNLWIKKHLTQKLEPFYMFLSEVSELSVVALMWMNSTKKTVVLRGGFIPGVEGDFRVYRGL